MPAARLIQIVGGVCGVIALTLGMGTYTHADFTDAHMLFGLLVTLVLLVLAIMATFTSELRRLGVVSIVYALIVPIFGVTQQMIWVGDWHWLIEAAHLLVGIGALGLIGTIGARLMRRQRVASSVSVIGDMSS